ncbi:putative methyltransferase Cher3 [Geobacter sp. OR-1]|uniref:CheR family methyltransferase n=1 Tax=Geobacter sp. OR-1 TaxID=1266765 RepID=UPI000542C3F1|nr:protein-glutamate O-methyltransferase CheR [Geobacter sp. OR-1]GAM09062.1 putative methyltransferase Cher3 [Geobacter sp. OR-1]
MDQDELFDIELRLLLSGINQAYGYDFTDYSEASLKRRIMHWFVNSDYATLSDAQARILRDRDAFESLLRGITVNVSEMFRDPPFFKAMRETVIPHLLTYPFVKIWHAGCATGEEAYSTAILLNEEGMAGRFRMYATDINNAVLQKARDGIFPLKEMQRYTRNYQSGGGKKSFSDYYTARYDHAIMMPALREQIVFASHNLVVDSDFGEMHLILCRNVLIYFKPTLKERVLFLFDNCLLPGGFLCIGLKESLEGRKIASRYSEVAPKMRIYRKSYG